MYALGQRGQRIYRALLERARGLPAGSQLPPLDKLAAEFGVAPLTVRHALSRLEEEGYVLRQQGRGTFVRERATPAVLVVDDELPIRRLLGAHVADLGYRAVEAADPAEGLAALAADPAIALVLTDVRMPTQEEGVAFIQAVRHRWPHLPLAAVTGYPDDLAPLHGTSDYPVLTIPKPVWADHVEEVVRLTLRDHPLRTRDANLT